MKVFSNFSSDVLPSLPKPASSMTDTSQQKEKVLPKHMDRLQTQRIAESFSVSCCSQFSDWIYCLIQGFPSESVIWISVSVSCDKGTISQVSSSWYLWRIPGLGSIWTVHGSMPGRGITQSRRLPPCNSWHCLVHRHLHLFSVSTAVGSEIYLIKSQ